MKRHMPRDEEHENKKPPKGREAVVFRARLYPCWGQGLAWQLATMGSAGGGSP